MERTPLYRHRQPGVVVRVATGAGAVIAAATGFLSTTEPTGQIIASVAVLVLLLALWLFNSLTVEVDTDRIRLWFGPGLIHRTFSVGEVERCRIVRNHWYYGWGVRPTPSGWLFAVSGLAAVQINLRSGRRYRIGTDEPRDLLRAVRRVIGADSGRAI